MKISKQAKRDAKELFRGMIVNGQLDETRAKALVGHVLTMKPRGYVAVLEHFQRLLKLEVARRTAKVESATALTPELKASVQANLAKRYGNGLRLEFVETPSLLGGLRIKVGSDVYDGSVRGRLAALQESF
jgi:F-type H+-transporting ATPase subunit delta